MTSNASTGAAPKVAFGVWAVVGVGLAFGGFFVLRYLGLWAENDTSIFVRSIAALMEAGSLTHPEAYRHGYAYPVWTAALANITGLEVSTLVATMLPLVSGVLLATTSYAAFSAMLGSRIAGLLGVGILFLVPELVFTVMRGNHEKLTVSLTLIAATALLAGFLELDRKRRWSVFAGWVTVMYLSAYTLASLNVFFGSSFIIAITLALAFSLVLVGLRAKRARQLVPIARRLVIVAATSWGLVALVLFFVYTPASDVLRLMSTASERLAALALSLEPESDPYAVTSQDWSNPWVYGALSSFRWFLFAGSFTWWAVLLVRTVRRPETIALHELFVIALYGAFGFQLALAIPVDLVGLDAGSNLQVRLFTYFSVIAAPMFVSALVRLAQALRARRGQVVIYLTTAGLVTLFALASMAKSTLEPTISNRWLFYRTLEVEAMRFWDERHLVQTLWTDPAGRLRYAYVMTFEEPAANGNTFGAWDVGQGVTHALRSEVIAASATAWRRAPSVLWAENRTFDNGFAQIFHRVPQTSFQR